MRRSRGFTLVEILVVLVIMSFLVAMAAVVTRAIAAQQRRSTTVTRMANVDAALVQFVIVNKRLPCPADGSIASTNAAAGTETAHDNATGCTTNQANGVVPWRALGIAETDATDGWERRLTYRIQPGLAIVGMLDMTVCDPAGTQPAAANGTCSGSCSAASPNCTSPLNYLSAPGIGKGLTVQNVAATTVMVPPNTGAAYVVISHGESGGGGMLASGAVYTSTTTDSTPEQSNYANLPYASGVYVDDSIMDAAGASHFDDLVSRPTIMSLVSKAGLGPRSHP